MVLLTVYYLITLKMFTSSADIMLRLKDIWKKDNITEPL